MRGFRLVHPLILAALTVFAGSALAATPTPTTTAHGEVFHLKIESEGKVLNESDLTLVEGGAYDAVKINRTVWPSGVTGQGAARVIPLLTGLTWRFDDVVELYSEGTIWADSVGTFTDPEAGITLQIPTRKTVGTNQMIRLPRGSVRVIEYPRDPSNQSAPVFLTLTRVGPAA